MQNLEWYLADLKSTGKNTIETVEKSLTDMFIRLVRIYPCLVGLRNIYYISRSSAYTSKHKTFVYHLCNVEPTLETLGRRCINVTQNVLCLLGYYYINYTQMFTMSCSMRRLPGVA